MRVINIPAEVIRALPNGREDTNESRKMNQSDILENMQYLMGAEKLGKR